MAIFHLSMTVVKRCSSGVGSDERARRKSSWRRGGTEKDRSAVGAAAYRAGVKLVDAHDGREHDYSHRKGVFAAEILLPSNAPRDYQSRGALWNAVELAERRYDARVAREMNMAIPRELDDSSKVALVRGFVRDHIVARGMAADVAYHDFQGGNPHAHVMMTMRELSETGFGKRLRSLDTWGSGGSSSEDSLVAQLRVAWCDACNTALAAAGSAARVDHRSLAAQRVMRLPTVHLGPKWTALNRSSPDTPMVARDGRSRANDVITRLRVIPERAWVEQPDSAAAARAAVLHYDRQRQVWEALYGREGRRAERLAAALGDQADWDAPINVQLRRSRAYQRRLDEIRRSFRSVAEAKREVDRLRHSAVALPVVRVAVAALHKVTTQANELLAALRGWLGRQSQRLRLLLRMRRDTIKRYATALDDKRQIDSALSAWSKRLWDSGSYSRVAQDQVGRGRRHTVPGVGARPNAPSGLFR